MPALPLYAPAPAHPDASHDVTSPGGYEWWYFDAEDAKNDLQVVAIFLHGFVFHPGYLRRYFAYLRRPTRKRPPLPSEYPCAYFAVYERGKLLAQFMSQYPTGSLLASRQRVHVEIGPNRLTHDAHSLRLNLEGRPWILTARGPQTQVSQTLKASLAFTPLLLHAPVQRPFFSRALTGADHHWVIANPLCSVEGTISVEGVGAVPARGIPFNGLGYHDHNYGSAPVGPGLRRWMWGRFLSTDRAATFHFATPRDGSGPAEVHLVEATSASLVEHPVKSLVAPFTRHTPLRLAYPPEVRFDDILHLKRPRIVDSAPFYMRLQYEARLRDTSGTAFCEIAYPHRLRMPVLGRMIEMSIDHCCSTPVSR